MEYDVTGELSEDGQFIQLHHFKLLKSVLRIFKGQKLDVRIRIYKERRSESQNRYMWGVVVPTIQRWLKETKGERHSKDEVYSWIKIQLLGVVPEVHNILGQEVIVMKELSFSKMTTAEFAHYTNLIIDKMAERDCHIPTPRGNNDLADFMGDKGDDDIIINPKITCKLPTKTKIELPKREVVDDDGSD